MIARQHEADLRLLSPPLDPEKEREAEQLLPRYPEARSTSAEFAHPAAELLTNRVHAHALLAELADRGIRGTGRTRPARLPAAGQRSELRHSLVDNCRLIDNASFCWDIARGLRDDG
jgi:hypothetical protein